MHDHRSRVVPTSLLGATIITVTCLLSLGSSIARAQICTPHPNFTDCTPPGAFQCPVDQAGVFCPGEPPFLAAFGNGVQPSGALLLIDQTCNGIVTDPADLTVSLPAEIQNILSSCGACQAEYRLSPTQDYLYVRVFNNSGTVPGCNSNQNKIFFYEVDEFFATLIPFTGDQGACVPSPISQPPVFHDEVGYPIRTAVLIGDQTSSVPVLWADLVGREVNLDTFNYAPVVQVPRFSPAGDAVLLDSIVGGIATDFALIDLCVSPVAGTGSITNRTANGAVIGLVQIISGSPVAQITHGASFDSFPLSGCVCGACCDGMSCTANVFAPDCTGTFYPSVGCNPTPCGGGSTDYTLVVDTVGPGTVTSNIGGIECPFVDCDANYPEGTTVQLTAEPYPGRIFVGWSGDCSGTNLVESVTLDGDHNCTATFRNQEADLEIYNIAQNTTPLVAGTDGQFTLSVRNNGPDPVTSYSFTVTPPAGFTPDPNHSDTGCNFPTTNQCTVNGTLGVGATDSIVVGFHVDPATRGSQTLSASVSGSLFDPDFANNSGSLMTTVTSSADLSISASVSPNPAPAGDLALVLATITNHGPSSATNLIFDHNLPSGLSAVDRDGNPISGTMFNCGISELAYGGDTPAQFFVRVDPNAAAGTLFDIDLSVSADEPDPDLLNNAASVTLTVGGTSNGLPIQRLVTLAKFGDPAPGGLGTFQNFYGARIQGENVVFTARTNIGIFAAGVFRTVGTELSVVADTFDTAPRYDLPFDNFDGPVLDGLDVYFNGIYLNPYNASGIHRSSQCGLETLLFYGDPAPGIHGEILGPIPQAYANGQLLLWNDGELLLWQNGSLSPVALRTQSTPDGEGATFTAMSLQADFDGQYAVFQANSTGGLNGIYYSQGATLHKIVDTTDIRPDTGTSFDYFNFETTVDKGYAVFARDAGQASEPVTIYGYDIATDQLEVIVDSNTPMPGGERNFDRVFAPADVQDGRVLFMGRGPDNRGYGIYLWENGQIRRVLARAAARFARDTFDGNRMIYQNELVVGMWGDPGDFDLDGLVDAVDGQALLGCLQGADIFQNPYLDPNAVDCLSAFDANTDDDVDARDYALWQRH